MTTVSAKLNWMAYSELTWRPFLGHQAWSWTTLRRGNVFYYVYKRFFYFCHVFLRFVTFFIFIWTFFYIYGEMYNNGLTATKNSYPRQYTAVVRYEIGICNYKKSAVNNEFFRSCKNVAPPLLHTKTARFFTTQWPLISKIAHAGNRDARIF